MMGPMRPHCINIAHTAQINFAVTSIAWELAGAERRYARSIVPITVHVAQCNAEGFAHSGGLIRGRGIAGWASDSHVSFSHRLD